MELTKQQIKQLRALANRLAPMLWVGKGGVTEASHSQAADVLESHELIKCVVQGSSPVDAREAAQLLAEQLSANIVQIIGHRFVLYRRSSREDVTHIPLV